MTPPPDQRLLKAFLWGAFCGLMGGVVWMSGIVPIGLWIALLRAR